MFFWCTIPKSGQTEDKDTRKSYRSLIGPGSAFFGGKKNEERVNVAKQTHRDNFNPGAENLSITHYLHLSEHIFGTKEEGS